MSSTQRLSVNLSSEEHRELAALAEKVRVSKAWLGRACHIRASRALSRKRIPTPSGFYGARLEAD